METYTPKNLKFWTLPECYAGASWDDWYVFLGQHRDSDNVSKSNFRCGLAKLRNVMSKETIGIYPSVFVVSESHWAVGWVEWIGIHKSDIEALKLGDEMMNQINEYPVLNEDDLTSLDDEEAQEYWKGMSVKDRKEYIRNNPNQFDGNTFGNFKSMLKGEYFGGWASELIN